MAGRGGRDRATGRCGAGREATARRRRGRSRRWGRERGEGPWGEARGPGEGTAGSGGGGKGRWEQAAATRGAGAGAGQSAGPGETGQAAAAAAAAAPAAAARQQWRRSGSGSESTAECAPEARGECGRKGRLGRCDGAPARRRRSGRTRPPFSRPAVGLLLQWWAPLAGGAEQRSWERGQQAREARAASRRKSSCVCAYA